jgi:hypothetical protein
MTTKPRHRSSNGAKPTEACEASRQGVRQQQQTRTCHGRLQSCDQLWYEGARLLGEREGTWGSPEEPGLTAWRRRVFDPDRQIDLVAEHTFDSVPHHPVPLEQVHGDLAHELEIVEEPRE